MRYWGSEPTLTSKGRARQSRDVRVKRKTTRPATSKPASKKARPSSGAKVTSGGSVGPFLRKFYRHQAVVSRPIQRLFLFLVLAGVFYAFVLGDGGAVRIMMLRHERAQIDTRIAELKKNTALLETEIARLESDPHYIEKIGRERYGFVHPDEHVYKIVPKPENTK
jgi:cell division protein FtsB